MIGTTNAKSGATIAEKVSERPKRIEGKPPVKLTRITEIGSANEKDRREFERDGDKEWREYLKERRKADKEWSKANRTERDEF
jgi:hypothetical protein